MKITKNIGLILAISLLSAHLAHSKHVTVGHLESSDAKVTAEVIKQIFERRGFNVATKSGGSELMFDMLADREIDFLVYGWLNTTHKDYWQKHKDKLVKIGLLFEGGKYVFAVPNYVPTESITTIEDLLKPDVRKKLNKQITLSSFHQERTIYARSAIQEYKLDEAGFTVKTVSDDVFYDEIIDQQKEKSWFVVGLRRPTFVNLAGDMRELSDPNSVFIKSADAHIVANKEAWEYIKKPMQEVLKRIEISIKSVEELDHAIRVRKMPTHDAARRWLGAHPYTVEYWLEPEYD